MLLLALVNTARLAPASVSPAAPPPSADPARRPADSRPVPDSLAAEAALAALAAGRLPEAYLALEPVAAARVDRTLPLAWSAQLIRARLLIRLGTGNAARAALPARPSPALTAAAPWTLAAWELTLAELERVTGRPQAALTAARRATQRLIHLTPTRHPLQAQGWLEIATAHSVLHQLDSALFYAERARTLLTARTQAPPVAWAQRPAPRLALPPVGALPVYALMGLVLGHQRTPGSIRIGVSTFASRQAAASACFDSAARLSRHPGPDGARLGGMWHLHGQHWAERALATDEEVAVRRADASFARAAALARSPADRAIIEIGRGELASKFYGPQESLPLYQRAQANLLGSGQPVFDPTVLPASFNSAAGQYALFYLLEQQAATYRELYTETGDPRHLDRFFAYATRLAEVLAYQREQARRGYGTESPGFDVATVNDNYALGVEAAEARFRRGKRPNDLAVAFRITQNAKAWRLLTRVGGQRATAGLRADDKLLARYQRAAAALRRWEECASLLSTYPALQAATDLVSAPDSAQAARSALAAITALLQQRHPALYARALSGSYALTLSQAQASLPADGQTAAVEFLRRTSFEDGLHQESVYAFVVQPTGTRLLRLALPPKFPELVDSLVEALARPGSRAYPALAARTYALVLAPVTRDLAPGVRHLIIAPDRELWRLPFEALLTRPPTPAERHRPDYRHLPYALRRWSFTYAHSLTLRARARAGDRSALAAPARLLALAPFGDPAQAQGLPFSGRLLTQLARTTGGEFFAGAAASRGALRRGAARADMLHLATHATADLADPAASALSLADGPMPLAELFGLPLHPRLVVLSACQTGVGRIGGPSESATSLSWGFTYAGAASTVATLWRVDDAATATTLGRFYRRLRGHAPKNVALHRAKLTALDSARTAAAADPFYWAGLVLTGDERPLTLAPAGVAAGQAHPGRALLVGALAGAVLLLGAGAWWAWRRA